MGVQVPRDIGTQDRLDALDKAGLKDEIKNSMKNPATGKDFDLKDPVQAVQAQEKLNELLPKINKAFADAGIYGDVKNEMAALQYKDPSGETIRASEPHSGGIATLNAAIQGFEQRDAPRAPAPQQQAAPPAPSQP